MFEQREKGISLVELLVTMSIASIGIYTGSNFLVNRARMQYAISTTSVLQDERKRLLNLINDRKIEAATINANPLLKNHVARVVLQPAGIPLPLKVYNSVGKMLLDSEQCLTLQSTVVGCTNDNAFLRIKSYWIPLNGSSYQLHTDVSEIAENKSKIVNLPLIQTKESKFKYSHAISQRSQAMECITASAPGPVTGPCHANYGAGAPVQCTSKTFVGGFPTGRMQVDSEHVFSYVQCPSTYPFLVSLTPIRGCGYNDSRTKILNMGRGECRMVIGGANYHCVGANTSLIDCQAKCCTSPGG